ncbi:MAG: hypothetical protein C0622_08655 [Desulfuromonas sp.]|nr:MAG: hypothetical protein C0622_08655 [Desulfuromonas sp.]
MFQRFAIIVLLLALAGVAPVSAAFAGDDAIVVIAAYTPTDSVDQPVVVAASAPQDDFAAGFDDDPAPGDASEVLIADPLEPLNRGVFWVNDKLYFYLFKPVARGYRAVLPHPVRVSVGNVFSNLGAPVRIGNSLLQFKIEDLGAEVYRFFINTTFGVGGLFDPAAKFGGVKPRQEDFGQTLGYYHLDHGCYLVLPIVGPSSLRDATGSFVDSFADPLRYTNLETEEYFAIKMVDMTNRLSLDRDTYEGIVRDSLDPYLFIRAAYAQRRQAQVGKTYNMNLLEGPLFDGDRLDPFNLFGQN